MRIIKSFVLLFALMLSAAVWAEPVNINTADASSMAEAIKGVGEKRAQAIVEYRKQHGSFKNIDELSKVKGIGDAIINKNRDNMTAGGN